MINPYQAPADRVEDQELPATGDAVFRLRESQIRYAESKYLLSRYGARLTMASLAMIALALLVAVDPLGVFPGDYKHPNLLFVSLFLRELVVMLLATFVYRSLIHQARGELRLRLNAQGVIDRAGVSFSAADAMFSWSGPRGTFLSPATKTYLMRTRKGLVIALPDGPFWFIPKNAKFSQSGYRAFLRHVKQQARPASDE